MKIDRILLDILDWVRRSLFWRKGRKTKKPYEVLKLERGQLGLLKLVERDTPRAVRTWVFTPFPRSVEGFVARHALKDYHLCLDHLYPLDGESRPKRPPKLSHRISVLQASRYLNQDGSYDTVALFVKSYDLVGHAAFRDRWAIAILDQLANIAGKIPIDKIQWPLEIELERKRFLGGDYRPSDPDET